MREVLLVMVLLAVFVLGFFAVKKVNNLITQNQYYALEQNGGGRSQIRIAAEKTYLLESIEPAWESCSAANPYLELSLQRGKSRRLLRKLQDGSVDIALLSEKSSENLSPEYTAVQIPDQAAYAEAATAKLSVAERNEGRHVYAVWNKKIKSKERDRVIFALENEYCREKHGYRDYLD